MNTMNRRTFITGSVLGASYALLGTPARSDIRSQINTTAVEGKKLIKRKLGRTDIELPVVSMGVMRSDNPALVRAALASGIVHLDTAHGYMKGKNESMLGEVLKDYARESFVLATKVGPDSKESFLEKLDLSLKRLQMDYVDILYLHGVSGKEEVLSAEMLDALRTAKATGKARHVGLSTHKNEPEVIRAAIESSVHEVVLTSVNFKQDHYPDLKMAIAEATAAGLGIVAMKTMAGAFLDKDKTKPVNCKAALKWVLQDENITTAIPGITTFEMLAENSSVNQDLRLTEQEKSDLAFGSGESGLYCQGCGNCTLRCSKGLPIPEIMRAYMYTYGYGDARIAHAILSSHAVRDNPCSDCGACPVSCTKGFHIRNRITDITRLTRVPAEFLA
jgi:predicted aldo/keto reductase-like oxidoreductase